MNSLNHLANETSLYLRQHAGNPVDWYPWGPEALQRAGQEQRPIFLSIGYSACHWCHVMEHESFMDPEVAKFLNDHFISIKVDREERPDLDNIYMSAVVALTGRGGWPMSVFLTPDLQPFYAGTYFPPQDRYGMPSFRRVLEAIHNSWSDKKTELVEQAESITAALRDESQRSSSEGMPLDETMFTAARLVLERAYDPRHGGFGQAPKFPHPFDLRLLLRIHDRYSDENALAMVVNTLDHMGRGGIFDQAGGGFHRYSTDERWLVPHFEKMLYDNALLVPVYLETYQITQKSFFRRIAESTLGWVMREMTSSAGGFHSTTDADSEGVEGKFFVWSEQEVKDLLGADADFALEVFDITSDGNWEGHNILTRPKTDAQEGKLRQLSEEEFLQRLNSVKTKLLAGRERRVKPGRDEKTLAAWNGLMIAAFAQAASILGEPVYAEHAACAADFVLTKMRQPDGKLFRTASETGHAKLNAYLEDYSFMIDSLVHLYEATFEPRWLRSAVELTDIMISQFWDEQEGGFFFVGRDHETLILREKQAQDNATPSGNSIAVTGLLRLGRLIGRQDYLGKAEQTLRLFAPSMAQQPMGFGQMLVALDDFLGPIEEFAIFATTPAEQNETKRLLFERYRPRKIITAPRPEDQMIPFLRERQAVGERTTVFRCINQACGAPWEGMEMIQQKLAQESS
jgi:uncharacterized protein YyaL (SSP411 family)